MKIVQKYTMKLRYKKRKNGKAMKHINKTATQYKMTTNGSHRELQRNFSSQTVIQH